MFGVEIGLKQSRDMNLFLIDGSRRNASEMNEKVEKSVRRAEKATLPLPAIPWVVKVQ